MNPLTQMMLLYPTTYDCYARRLASEAQIQHGRPSELPGKASPARTLRRIAIAALAVGALALAANAVDPATGALRPVGPAISPSANQEMRSAQPQFEPQQLACFSCRRGRVGGIG